MCVIFIYDNKNDPTVFSTFYEKILLVQLILSRQFCSSQLNEQFA